MKALLLRAVVLARRRKQLAESTRRTYQARLDRELNAIMVLAPTNHHGRRLRKRYGKVRSHLFTFLEHPEVPPDNNGSERELRPTATYRKVTGGFRSHGVLICSPAFDPSSEPQRDEETMRIRRFSQSWTGNLSFSRVEQILIQRIPLSRATLQTGSVISGLSKGTIHIATAVPPKVTKHARRIISAQLRIPGLPSVYAQLLVD